MPKNLNIYMAGMCGNRTHRRQVRLPAAGFEVQDVHLEHKHSHIYYDQYNYSIMLFILQALFCKIKAAIFFNCNNHR